MKKLKLVLAVVVIIVVVAIIAIAVKSFSGNSDSNSGSEKETNTEETTDETTTPATSTVTLISVGDIVNHTPVLSMALQDDGTYDFSNLFVNMKEDIQRADVAVVNCESILGGSEGGYPYDGYPNFNSPDSLGDAFIDAGFDVILQANNHARDAGVSGIEHCLQYWEAKKDLAMLVGVNASQEDRDEIDIKEVNGIKIAFLNYTYGINGYTLPDDQQYLVNIMNDSTWDLVKSDIERASELADIVIVLPHWGTEYVVGDVTDEQVRWANMFVEAGADLIIGTHPHVAEKIEMITSENGNQALCYYSLGNFTSNQAMLGTEYSNYTQLEGMAVVKIVKEYGEDAYIDIENSGVVPVVCHNDRVSGVNISAYRLDEYTEDLCNVHQAKVQGYEFSLDWLNTTAQNIFGDWIISW